MSMALVLAALAATPPVGLVDPLGRETEATMVAHAVALHRRMGLNGDGFVTQAEVAAFLRSRLPGIVIPGTDAAHPLPPTSLAAFTAGDTDHDGRISLAEEVAGAKRAFALQDRNHDGIVTPDERMAFIVSQAESFAKGLGGSRDGSPPTAAREQAPPDAWSPPAQAVWTGDSPPVAVAIVAPPAVSMAGKAQIDIVLSVPDAPVAMSPFLQATRGIAFDVRTAAGVPVRPRSPMTVSPPPPPLGPTDLTRIDRATPFHVAVREAAQTIFPGPGTYQVSAVVSLFDPGATPVRRARIVSPPVMIRAVP